MLSKEFVCSVDDQEQPLVILDTVVFENDIYLLTHSDVSGEIHIFRVMAQGLKFVNQQVKDKILEEYQPPSPSGPPPEVHLNLNLGKEETKRVLKKLGL